MCTRSDPAPVRPGKSSSKLASICADSGGSNAARNRAWKYHLQKFSDEAKLEIVVGHYPPGTSKWNKIEQSYVFLHQHEHPVIKKHLVLMNHAVKTIRNLSKEPHQKSPWTKRYAPWLV